ncbi:MAG TPA: FAD-dependent oxidoreductase [Gemmatimonadales bacterium]|nr:FAD-dependent oxidoreductase [Gemmatimonadales bacterium]
MPRNPDVVVIGAGIVGAACAWYLARAGQSVLVLEGGFAGGSATAAGMGHIVVLDDSEAQFALTSWSVRLLAELREELPREVECEWRGTLWVAEDESQLAAARARAGYYSSRGVAAEVLGPRDLATEEPALRSGLAGGLRVPGDGVVYPPALTRWLLDGACRAGAEVRQNVTVERITPGAVDASGGRIACGLVVNAAGAAAPRLTPGLPIVPRKGHLVITDRYPGLCRHQIVELGYLRSAHTMTTSSVAFNVQPRATGQLLIGSSRELVGWEPAVNQEILARMLRRATDFIPALARLRAIRTWTGFRPATPDKLPLIGPWSPGSGLWIAAGHEGLGITTALGTGRLLSDLMLGRQPAIDPAPFVPGREMPAGAD